MKRFCFATILLLIASVVHAAAPTATTVVQLSDLIDADGNLTSPAVLAVTWDDEPVDVLPPHNPTDNDSVQKWYIAFQGKFYGFEFTRSVPGLYAVRVSFDGILWGSWGECEIEAPEAPVHP